MLRRLLLGDRYMQLSPEVMADLGRLRRIDDRLDALASDLDMLQISVRMRDEMSRLSRIEGKLEGIWRDLDKLILGQEEEGDDGSS